MSFWDDFVKSAYTGTQARDVMGNFLLQSEREEREAFDKVKKEARDRVAGRSLEGNHFTSMRNLARPNGDPIRLPVQAGMKVQFASDASAIMSYEDPPAPNATGIVVAVKTASGSVTEANGHVFVKFPDKRIRAIHPSHLTASKGAVRTPTAKTAIRVASLGDLSDFLRVAGSESTLIHKATKDLWSVKKDAQGYLIERLFTDDSTPLKV
jgi:hypothetical protein